MRRRQTGAQIGVHQAVDGEIDARVQVRQHGRVQVDGQRHDRETERKTLVNFRSFAYKMAEFLGVLPTRWRRGRFACKMAVMPRRNADDATQCRYADSNALPSKFSRTV